jgi:FRG domain
VTNAGHDSGADTDPLAAYACEITFDDAYKLLAFLGDQQFRQGRWIFRGQPKSAWPLQPTLERFSASLRDRPHFLEPYILSEFRRRAHHFISDTPNKDDMLDWLALMRHYGAPTRLLDFTKSPYVAAFFASADATAEASAAIWAVDGFAIKRYAADLLNKGSMSAILKRYGEKGFTDPTFSFSDPEVFKDLLGGGVPAHVVIPVEPFRTNERVLLQQGMFLCPLNLHLKFEQALKNVVRRAKEDAAFTTHCLYKISIGPNAHPKVLRELHRMNISYATLLPGLEGLAQSLSTVCKIRATTVPAELPPDYEFGSRF